MNLILADKNIEKWPQLIESDTLVSSLDEVINNIYANESCICKETAKLDDIQLVMDTDIDINLIYFYPSPEYFLSKKLNTNSPESALEQSRNYTKRILDTKRRYKNKISFVNYHHSLSDNRALTDFLHYNGFRSFNTIKHKPSPKLKLLVAKSIISSNDNLRDQCDALHAISLPLSNNFNTQYDEDALLSLFKLTSKIEENFDSVIHISDLQPVQQELISTYEMLEQFKVEIGIYKTDTERAQNRFLNQRWELRKSKIISRGLRDSMLYIAHVLQSKQPPRRKLKDFLKRKHSSNQHKIIELYTIASSGFFDTTWYLEKNKDVKASGMPAIIHFYYYGASEGRSPSKRFDAMDYLTRYPDVRESKTNPLLHYLNYGKNESRTIKRVGEKK